MRCSMKTVLLYNEVSGVDPAVFKFPGDNYLINFNNCATNSHGMLLKIPS